MERFPNPSAPSFWLWPVGSLVFGWRCWRCLARPVAVPWPVDLVRVFHRSRPSVDHTCQFRSPGWPCTELWWYSDTIWYDQSKNMFRELAHVKTRILCMTYRGRHWKKTLNTGKRIQGLNHHQLLETKIAAQPFNMVSASVPIVFEVKITPLHHVPVTSIEMCIIGWHTMKHIAKLSLSWC